MELIGPLTLPPPPPPHALYVLSALNVGNWANIEKQLPPQPEESTESTEQGARAGTGSQAKYPFRVQMTERERESSSLPESEDERENTTKVSFGHVRSELVRCDRSIDRLFPLFPLSLLDINNNFSRTALLHLLLLLLLSLQSLVTCRQSQSFGSVQWARTHTFDPTREAHCCFLPLPLPSL